MSRGSQTMKNPYADTTEKCYICGEIMKQQTLFPSARIEHITTADGRKISLCRDCFEHQCFHDLSDYEPPKQQRFGKKEKKW